MDGQTDGLTDGWTEQKHLCLQPVWRRHNYEKEPFLQQHMSYMRPQGHKAQIVYEKMKKLLNFALNL